MKLRTAPPRAVHFAIRLCCLSTGVVVLFLMCCLNSKVEFVSRLQMIAFLLSFIDISVNSGSSVMVLDRCLTHVYRYRKFSIELSKFSKMMKNICF